MRRFTIVSLFAAGMLALVPFSAALAASAPSYISSSPEDGAELSEAPDSVTVTFSEPLDAESELRIFHCGKRIDSGDSTVTVNEIRASLAAGPVGMYEARWVVEGFGGVTGGSSGFISFHVGDHHSGCSGSGHGGGHGSGGHGSGGHGSGGHGGGGHSGGDGSGGKGHGGSGHSGSGGSGSHSGSDHSGSGSSGSHSGSSGSSHSSGTGHSAGAAGSGGDHGSGKHSGKSHSGKSHSGKGHGSDEVKGAAHGSDHGDDSETASGTQDFASDGGPLGIPTPEPGAVLLALVACIGLGVSAGWLARLV